VWSLARNWITRLELGSMELITLCAKPFLHSTSVAKEARIRVKALEWTIKFGSLSKWKLLKFLRHPQQSLPNASSGWYFRLYMLHLLRPDSSYYPSSCILIILHSKSNLQTLQQAVFNLHMSDSLMTLVRFLFWWQCEGTSVSSGIYRHFKLIYWYHIQEEERESLLSAEDGYIMFQRNVTIFLPHMVEVHS